MQVNALDHVNIITADLDGSARFYAEVFGAIRGRGCGRVALRAAATAVRGHVAAVGGGCGAARAQQREAEQGRAEERGRGQRGVAPERGRVRRGTRFSVGDALGTVNRMAHVHLSIGPSGYERNAIGLGFTGFTDASRPERAIFAFRLSASLASAKAPSVRVSPPATRPVPASVLRPPRMVGRSRERSSIEQLWSEGRAALLLGEPGMGKSRLLQALDVYRTHCQPSAVHHPGSSGK